MKHITSAQNPRLKNAVRLKTSRGRKTQRRIIIFGRREVQRALASGIEPLELFLSSEMLSPGQIGQLELAVPGSTAVYDLPAELMQRLKYGERDLPVVAIAQRPDLSLENLKLTGPCPLVVILQSVEKPGNIGAVLRSMDGAGADALLLVEPGCDVYHPNCIRASMGSVFTIPLAVAEPEAVLDWCRHQGLQVLAARDSAAQDYTSLDWRSGIALALGNEAEGLSKELAAAEITGVRIPMQGISDSLNVSVAAAVILYEAARQRSRIE